MAFTNPETLHVAFAEAVAKKDVEALLELYEPTAITELPDGTRLTDQDSRRQMLEGLLASGAENEGTARKVVVAGDIALTSTSYEAPPGGESGGAETLLTAEVSRRQPDGSWRVVIDAPTFA